MTEWSADILTDPDNDYEMIIEILYNDVDVGVIREGKDGLVLKWYANQDDISVPLDWLANLINRARIDLKLIKERLKEVEKEEN